MVKRESSCAGLRGYHEDTTTVIVEQIALVFTYTHNDTMPGSGLPVTVDYPPTQLLLQGCSWFSRFTLHTVAGPGTVVETDGKGTNPLLQILLAPYSVSPHVLCAVTVRLKSYVVVITHAAIQHNEYGKITTG